MALREMLHFVQHDKARPRSHRLGVINARCGRLVAKSSNGIKVAKFDMVEDNVQKTSFSYKVRCRDSFCGERCTESNMS